MADLADSAGRSADLANLIWTGLNFSLQKNLKSRVIPDSSWDIFIYMIVHIHTICLTPGNIRVHKKMIRKNVFWGFVVKRAHQRQAKKTHNTKFIYLGQKPKKKNVNSNVAKCLLAKARSKDYKCRLHPDFEACGQLGQILIRPWAPLPFCNVFLQKETALFLMFIQNWIF